MRTVYGLFNDYIDANAAVEDLLSHGYTRSDMGIIAHAESLPTEPVAKEDLSDGAVEGAASGAVIGGITGLIAGVTTLAVPGFGPLIAAGTMMAALASTLAGAGIGAAAGSVIGALVDWGIPDTAAGTYAKALKDGKVLLAMHAPEMKMREVKDVLKNHGASEVNAYQHAGAGQKVR